MPIAPLLAVLALTAFAAPSTDPRGGGAEVIEARISELLGRMTLEEKLGQLQQLDGNADGTFRPEHLELARADQARPAGRLFPLGVRFEPLPGGSERRVLELTRRAC